MQQWRLWKARRDTFPQSHDKANGAWESKREIASMRLKSRPATLFQRCFGGAFLAPALLLLLPAFGIHADESKYEKFDAASFDKPTEIDNPWFSFVPGKLFVYEGTTTDDEGEEQPHRVEIYVTDLTKVIDGVPSLVTWDLDYAEGELVEAELAFFAQDKHGNVWRMGEHPEEYEDGKVVDAPTWIAGIDDAKAGISMRADPRVGTPSYSQGWAPAVEYTDRGVVDQRGQKVSVPVGTFEDVVVIAESSEDDGPDAIQLKYFARGVGHIKVGWRGEGDELLDLVEIRALGEKEMHKVRSKVVELEKHAYEISPEVYALTQPLERNGTALGNVAARAPAKKAAMVRNISDEQAKKIAVETVPGEVTDIGIERKLGKKAIVVEVIAAADMSETDVIIDMETGEVLGTEK